MCLALVNKRNGIDRNTQKNRQEGIEFYTIIQKTGEMKKNASVHLWEQCGSAKALALASGLPYCGRTANCWHTLLHIPKKSLQCQLLQ